MIFLNKNTHTHTSNEIMTRIHTNVLSIYIDVSLYMDIRFSVQLYFFCIYMNMYTNIYEEKYGLH